MAPWVEKEEGVVFRKIDIVNWESEAAMQMNAEFDPGGIPFTLVYDAEGELIGEVSGADFEGITALARKPR